MDNWENTWVDLYAILGINRDANDEEIKKAYKALVKKCHPDIANYIKADSKTIKEMNEKFEAISCAYEILSDPKKKSAYDKVYDEKAKQAFSTSSDNQSEQMNYDEAKENYSEAAKKAAEQESIKLIIQEEVERCKLYIKSKNEILLDAFTGKMDNDEFFIQIQELQSLTVSYLGDLNKLMYIAYDYELLTQIELLENTITFIETEFENLPTNITENTKYMNQDFIHKKLQEFINSETVAVNLLVHNIRSFTKACTTGEIVPINFESKKKLLLLRLQTKLTYLEQLKEISLEYGFENELATLSTLHTKIDLNIKIFPSTFKDARRQENFLKSLDTLKEYNNKLEQLENKMNRIFSLIHRYPKSGLCKRLCSMAEETLVDMTRTATEAQKYQQDHKLSSESLGTEIKKLSVESESIYAKANQLNVNIDKFYQENRKQIVNENGIPNIFESKVCQEKIPAYIKCQAIDLENQMAELLNLYHFANSLDNLTIKDGNIMDIINELKRIELLVQEIASLKENEKQLQERLNTLRNQKNLFVATGFGGAMACFAISCLQTQDTEVNTLFKIGLGTSIIGLFLVAKCKGEKNSCQKELNDVQEKIKTFKI